MQDRCYQCNNGLLMPDGTAWCQLTVTPRNICSEYFFGNGKIYKPDKIRVIKKTTKVKVKEIKPIVTKPVTAKPVVKANKKSSSQQGKLF